MREPSFILQILGMILVIWLLGNYAIKEGLRIESKKKFMKNMDEFDKDKQWVGVW